jgi:ElaB/YqjD/DUF883 family membrane-anchored ribosome-binding protein
MSENYTEGGAGPSLAAHSKDGSIRGQTPASEATGQPATPSNMARDAVSNAAASANRVLGQAGDMVSARGGQAADRLDQFVREQPVLALVVTGIVCLTLGVFLGRR